MRPTTQLSTTLPNQMADEVQARVTAGSYSSESEVIEEGLRALVDREMAVEQWLRTEVTQSYKALQADPSRAISPAEMATRVDLLIARASTA